MNETIDILLFFALSIFIIYISIVIIKVISKLEITKKIIENLEGFGDFSFAIVFLFIFLYPLLFLSNLKEGYLKIKNKNKKDSFFIGWGHVLGLHLPILLLWIALWLYFINFMKNFISNNYL